MEFDHIVLLSGWDVNDDSDCNSSDDCRNSKAVADEVAVSNGGAEAPVENAHANKLKVHPVNSV